MQKYYDSITKAVLGNDLKLMKVGNSQTTGQASIPEIQNHKKERTCSGIFRPVKESITI